MDIWKNAVLTDKGNELQSKLLNGECLQITKVKTGAGEVPLFDLRKQTDVTDFKQEIDMKPPKIKGDQITIPVLLENTKVPDSYDLWQVGFFAKDPDYGEILYCLAQASEKKHVPSAKESPGFSITWEFTFKYSDTLPVEVAVDPAGLVSLNEYNIHSNAIQNLENGIKELGNLVDSNKTDLSGQINTVKNNLQSDIQKINSNFTALASRVSYLERDTGWIEVTTFYNGCGHYNTGNNGYDKLKARKIGKVVQIAGAIKNSYAISDTKGNKVSLFYLPDAIPLPSSWSHTALMQGSGKNSWMMSFNGRTIELSRYGTTAFAQVPAGSWLNCFYTYLTE